MVAFREVRLLASEAETLLDPLVLLAALGLMLVSGFVSDFLFRRTLIPDTVFLMCLGILLGPVLEIFPLDVLGSLAPFVGSLALIVILLDQGMELSYGRVWKQAPRALLLSSTTFVFSTLLISLVARFVLDLPWLQSLMLGGALGGTSSVIVPPLLDKLQLERRAGTALFLDSVATDVLCIVFVLTLCQLGMLSLSQLGRQFALVFLSALALGTLAGLAWLSGARKLLEFPCFYTLLLSFSLLLYVGAEWMGISGGISVFAFALTLGNAPKLGRLFSIPAPKLKEDVRRFHDEVTFIIRTFFLVYLGCMLTHEFFDLLPVSVLIFLVAWIARYFSARLSALGDPLLGKYSGLIGCLFPKGLASAVLAYLPLQYGYEQASSFPAIVLTVILLSNLLSVGACLKVRRK